MSGYALETRARPSLRCSRACRMPHRAEASRSLHTDSSPSKRFAEQQVGDKKSKGESAGSLKFWLGLAVR